MADVFLSHKSERRAAAEHLADILTACGFSVWWDYGLVADADVGEGIAAELRAAKAVVVLWCSRAVEAPWVREEAALAKRLKRLVPVRVEKVRPPKELAALQMVDLSDWSGAPRDSRVDDLIDAVSRMVGRRPRPNREKLERLERRWRRFGGPTLAEFALVEALEDTAERRLQVSQPSPPAPPPPRPEPRKPAPPPPASAPAAKRPARGDWSGSWTGAGLAALAVVGVGGWLFATGALPLKAPSGQGDDVRATAAPAFTTATALSTETVAVMPEADLHDDIAQPDEIAWPYVDKSDPEALARYEREFPGSPRAAEAASLRAALAPPPDAAADQSAETGEEVVDRHALVTDIQRELSRLSLYKGAPDGIAGPGTESATAALARETDIEAPDLTEAPVDALADFADQLKAEPAPGDGAEIAWTFVDKTDGVALAVFAREYPDSPRASEAIKLRRTLAANRRAKAAREPAQRKAILVDIQRELERLDLYAGGADGIAGPGTAAAAGAFAAGAGLEAPDFTTAGVAELSAFADQLKAAPEPIADAPGGG
ncbi:MAG: TIR domain-containing protein [Caulobacterales bacterium]|nr:TIR domain-containing protein [Caulobacterales bacterium]